MVPLHRKARVDDLVKPPQSDESSSDDEVVVSSKGNTGTDEALTSSSRQSLRGDVTFPIKLHEMLMDVEREDNDTIVSWSPDGKGFRVHKQTMFVEKILPRYFSQTKYRSFQRQLNHYGFDRILKGPYEGGYRHPDFVRDDPIRCRSMRRLKRNIGPKRLLLDETPSRHDDNSLHGIGKVVAVSPEPSHHGSPRQGFEATRECSFSSFQSPMFRPVPQYHRARIVMGPPFPVQPPSARPYYHNPSPSQPHVTHVYYMAPPDFHQAPPYRIEYPPPPPPPVDRVPTTYQAYYVKATMPITGPMSPYNEVRPGPSYGNIPRNPELFVLSSPPLHRKPPAMGMVPVEESGVAEPARPTSGLNESCKPPRRKRHSFSSVNSNQEKSIDDLLLDFLSDEEQDGTDDHREDDGDGLLDTMTGGENVPNRNHNSQFVHEPVCDFPHNLVYNDNASIHHRPHYPHLVSMEATQTVAL